MIQLLLDILLFIQERVTPMAQWVKNPLAIQETQYTQVPALRSGRSHGGGNGNPLQYSCLKNFMDRGFWWATIHGVTKSWPQLSD